MPLRRRLTIATAISLLLALLVVDVAAVVLLSRSQLRQIDDSLDLSYAPIEQLASVGSRDTFDAISQVAPGTYVAVVGPNGDTQFSVSPSDRDRGRDDVRPIDSSTLGKFVDQAMNNADSTATIEDRDGDRVRLRIDPLDSGSTLITGLSLHEPDEVRASLIRILGAATLAALAAATALAWGLISRGLRPLHLVEASARAITDGELADHRVPGADEPTEVGQLASSLNSMLDRLEIARDERERTVAELQASDVRMRRFVADASHELRTPIAATAAYAELFERGAKSRPDDLDRAMTGIRGETGRMAELVDSLLALTRLDEKRELQVEHVDMTEVVFAAVDAGRTVAPARKVETAIREVVLVEGDPVGLRQIVDNLLANVRAHTPAETATRVELLTEDGFMIMRVSDDGPGVAESDLTLLFDRFYRVDASRTRSRGGAGLGLSIVAAIVAAHGGEIGASNNEAHGLTIEVRLPSIAGQTIRG